MAYTLQLQSPALLQYPCRACGPAYTVTYIPTAFQKRRTAYAEERTLLSAFPVHRFPTQVTRNVLRASQKGLQRPLMFREHNWTSQKCMCLTALRGLAFDGWQTFITRGRKNAFL